MRLQRTTVLCLLGVLALSACISVSCDSHPDSRLVVAVPEDSTVATPPPAPDAPPPPGPVSAPAPTAFFPPTTEGRTTTTAGQAPGSAPGAPTTAPGPPKAVTPQCGAITTFSLLNYTVGLIDRTTHRADFQQALDGLDRNANESGALIPELKSSFHAVYLLHKSELDGTPEPTPAPGDPTFAQALDRIGRWQAEHC